MEFSPQQERAFGLVRKWLDAARKGGQPIFRLFGYAGTGKTTIAKHIGDMESRAQKEHGVDRDEDGDRLPVVPQYSAFTGKAAVVMQKKGCENARTLHSIIYTTMDKSREALFKLQGELAKLSAAAPQDLKAIAEVTTAIVAEEESLKQPGFSLKPNALMVRHWDEDEHRYIADYRISMFIIDECSMVDTRLGSDLLSFKAPVLVLGDPAQLPPVKGGGYFTSQEPDVLLTEIHRQAKGDPIIDLATTVRSGGSLQLGTYGESRVVTRDALTQQEWLDADQILVGKNVTRDGINRRCRQLLGHVEMLPEPGEKLVCLKNNSDDGLLNGSLWECLESRDHGSEEVFTLRIRSLDEDRETTVIASKAKFVGLEEDPFERRRSNQFDYGYALTVHKSQGSQWDRVILMDEWRQGDRDKWLYTGITRAAKSITVVR